MESEGEGRGGESSSGYTGRKKSGKEAGGREKAALNNVERGVGPTEGYLQLRWIPMTSHRRSSGIVGESVLAKEVQNIDRIGGIQSVEETFGCATRNEPIRGPIWVLTFDTDGFQARDVGVVDCRRFSGSALCEIGVLDIHG